MIYLDILTFNRRRLDDRVVFGQRLSILELVEQAKTGRKQVAVQVKIARHSGATGQTRLHEIRIEIHHRSAICSIALERQRRQLVLSLLLLLLLLLSAEALRFAEKIEKSH